jgi:hypothetical protein
MNLDMTVAVTHNFVPSEDADSFLQLLSLEYEDMGITEEEYRELARCVHEYVGKK